MIALSLARAARNPALEELYFFGPHPGNLAFEIGNPDLQSERGLGFDVSVRGRGERFEGELTFFRNDIKHYVFRNPLSEEEFHEREEEFDERFGVEEEPGEEHDHGDFPFVEFVGRDSTLMGFEAHADVKLTDELHRRGDVRSGARRVVRHRRSAAAHSAGAADGRPDVSAQRLPGRRQRDVGRRSDRVYGEETPTEGYAIGRVVHVVLIQSRRRAATPSPRGSTTPPTSCIAIT